MTPVEKAALEVRKIVTDKAYTLDELHDLSGVSRTRINQTRRDPDTVVDALTFRKVQAFANVYLTQEQKKYTEDEIKTVKKMLEKGLASVPQPEKILFKTLVDNALEDPSILLVLLKKARVING